MNGRLDGHCAGCMTGAVVGLEIGNKDYSEVS